MGRTFYVVLQNPKGIVWAGDVLSGTAILETDEDIKMNGLFIEVNGEGNVHWVEKVRAEQGRTKKVHYKNAERYFSEKITLIEEKTGGSTTLTPGTYKYPFEYKLPEKLPASFDGQHGKTRYTIKATFDIPWGFDLVTNKAFIVLRRMDLNKLPDAALGQSASDAKSLCCLCCTSGPITATMSIPRTGYTPGESIPITASANNQSNREMDVTFSLDQTIVYKASNKTKRAISTVKKMTKKGLPEKKEEVFTDVGFKVPGLPPSFLNGCSIIDIRYKLKMKIDPYGPAIDICLPLDIIIGNVALNNVKLAYNDDNAAFDTTNESNQKNGDSKGENTEGEFQADYLAPPAPQGQADAADSAIPEPGSEGTSEVNKSRISLAQVQPDRTSLPGTADD